MSEPLFVDQVAIMILVVQAAINLYKYIFVTAFFCIAHFCISSIDLPAILDFYQIRQKQSHEMTNDKSREIRNHKVQYEL